MTKEEILAMEAGLKLDDAIHRQVMSKGEPSLIHPLPKYSEDILAAWSVIEKMKENWDCIELIWDVGAWDICLENYETHQRFYLGKEAGETYEKLPEAICKVALLTKLHL